MYFMQINFFTLAERFFSFCDNMLQETGFSAVDVMKTKFSIVDDNGKGTASYHLTNGTAIW
jgi:hypothetical protein